MFNLYLTSLNINGNWEQVIFNTTHTVYTTSLSMLHKSLTKNKSDIINDRLAS